MRKVILNLAVTLDGYIEGPNGEYDWCFTDQDYGMSAFHERIDTILMGAQSFKMLIGFGAPYPEYKLVVASSLLDAHNFKNVTVVRDDIGGFVRKLIDEPGKDIWLWGGAKLFQSLLEHKLVHELMLSVHPILLGSGLQLYPALKNRKVLKLTNSIMYSSGLVQLYYNL
jgi:dihydrofolate reductase